MAVFYENKYMVDSRDVDPFGFCRPSALLGILQEGATAASEAIHISRKDIGQRYNAFWMLARIWYRLDRPLRWGEEILVKTWHRGGRGAAMYRDFDLTVDGEIVGEAVSTWVMARLDTHKLIRLSDISEFAGTEGGTLCKDKLLYKLRLPEELHFAEGRRLSYSDADMNGHVNNARYADFACDALGMENLGKDHFVSSLQMGYLAQCLPGEELMLLTTEEDGIYYVRGGDREGKHRFEAALNMTQLPTQS